MWLVDSQHIVEMILMTDHDEDQEIETPDHSLQSMRSVL